MDYLHETWAGDRKTEWSIWMVRSKADIPHRYLKSGSDESYNLNVPGKISPVRKMSDDVINVVFVLYILFNDLQNNILTSWADVKCIGLKLNILLFTAACSDRNNTSRAPQKKYCPNECEKYFWRVYFRCFSPSLH